MVTRADWLEAPYDEFLFHYTKLSTAVDGILKSGTIQFGKLQNTNDPYERQIMALDLDIGSANFSAGHPHRELLRHAYSELTNVHSGCNLLCTTMDVPTTEHTRGFRRRGFNVPNLWAHYGDNHKGICLVFNKARLVQEVQRISESISADYFCEHVRYDDPPNNGDPAFSAFDLRRFDTADEVTTGMLKHLKRYKDTLFLWKDKTWKYENEFRFAIIKNNNNQISIDLPKFISGIILGYDYPNSRDNEIIQAKIKYSVPVARIHWYKGTPSVHKWFE